MAMTVLGWAMARSGSFLRNRPLPWMEVVMPRSLRTWKASRNTLRLIIQRWTSSLSGGKGSPGAISPLSTISSSLWITDW